MPSASRLQLIQEEHHCPDCLYLELEGDLIEPTMGLLDRIPLLTPKSLPGAPVLTPKSLPGAPEISLHVTLQFNEQWATLPGGQIKFGLRGGELRLKLDNGEMPLASRELGAPFEPTVQKEREQQERLDSFSLW